jgi:hypothetical protein
MVEIHNGILAACTKNAQLKKQVAQDTTQTNINHPLVTTAQATARLTLQERLAAVTKGKQNPSASSSEVTSIAIPPPLPQRKPKYDNDNDALLIQQAFDQVGSLEDIISGRIPEEEQKEEETEAVFNCCKGIQSNISLKIPQVADASHLGKYQLQVEI